MKNIIVNQHITSALNSLKRLRERIFSSFFIILMLAIALALPLTLYLSVASFDLVLSKLTLNPTLTVFMQKDTTGPQNKAFAALLKRFPEVKTSRFVAKDKALKDTALLLNEPDLPGLFEKNPLPDAFVLTAATNDPRALEKLTRKLRKEPQVAEVALDSGWVKTVYLLQRFLTHILVFLAVTLGLAFILITHNTIRLQILSCKEEIEVSHLLGAPASFIRRPFLYQALWQALLTSLLALSITAGIMLIAYGQIKGILAPYGIAVKTRLFTPEEIFFIVILVAALGLIGAAWATWQFLHEFKRQVF